MSLSLLQATIYFIIVKSTFYQVNSQDISIIRGERDIFTNEAGCPTTKAVCFDKNCTFCQCERESGTFIGKGARYGECVSDENLANVTAVRCEKFQDGSSVLILNKTSQCEETSECLGEKEINVSRNVTECTLSPNQAQYLHKDEWKTLLVETDSFDVVTSENNVSLKWNWVKTPKSWKGLIVKVQFQCKSDGEDHNKDIYCVLLKYTGNFTGFDSKSGGENDGDKDQATAIVVSVLVIALVIGGLAFFAYKNKKRLVRLIGRNAAKQDERRHPPSGQTSGASNNPIYHSGHTSSAQKDCVLYEVTVPEPVYHYACAAYAANKALPGALPQSNVTHDYATPGDHIGRQAGIGTDEHSKEENIVCQNGSAMENTENLPPVYHVLENN